LIYHSYTGRDHLLVPSIINYFPFHETITFRKELSIMKKLFITFIAITLIAFFSIPAMADQTNTQSAVINQADNAAAANVGEVGASSSIDSHDTNISNNPKQDRSFPIPGRVGYGPVINYYGKPLPTAGFRPVESLLMYANIFSEGALESILVNGSNADLITDLNIVRGKAVQVRASYEKGEARWIKIVASTEMQKDHGLIGYITCEADDRKTDMMEVVAGAALEALREGADVLQIVAQGASRDTETSGWGIGFNTTQATMLSGGSTGSGGANVSSGGTGYSTAWAGMRDKPWIQANALKSPDKVIGHIAKVTPAPEAPAKVKITEVKEAEPKKVAQAPAEQTGNHTSAGSDQ
jgi:hypothetical protein